MQSTNTGILKPALWHTPAITKDGIIRQAPDPRENHEGFTSRSPVADRASRGGPHLDGSEPRRPTRATAAPRDALGVRRGSGWGYLRRAERCHRRVHDVRHRRCASPRCSISGRHTQVSPNLMGTHRNSMLNREPRRG